FPVSGARRGCVFLVLIKKDRGTAGLGIFAKGGTCSDSMLGVHHISRFSRCGNQSRSPLLKSRGKICSSSAVPPFEHREGWGTQDLKLNFRFESLQKWLYYA